MNGLIIFLFTVFVVPVLPLYFLVKVLGGETGLLKVIGVKIIWFIVLVALTKVLGGVGTMLVILATLYIYHEAFKLGLVRTILVWLLEGLILAGLLILFIFVLGMSAAGLL